MTSKINYGASKRRTNTDIASKITKPFDYSVLQDLMIGRFYGCRHAADQALLAFGLPEPFVSAIR
jgi:hypothetical protein